MIIVCDIDNTISASWRREPLISEEGWDAFHADGNNDEAIEEMVVLVNALYNDGHRIVCLTGRPERWRNLTLKWLYDKGVLFTELWMRGDDDYRPAKMVKLDLARTGFGGELSRVGLVLEDVEDIAAAWRAEGVTVLHVHARRPT